MVPMFTIYPAIDIREGRCVRLNQGKADQETRYFEDPMEPGHLWKAAGASWLHVVDLDGAFQGQPQNLEVIGRLAGLGLKVQMGGGLRDLETVSRALDCGVSRVVIGTRACEDPEFLRSLVERFGAEKIAVGIDAKDGKVAVKGWVSVTAIEAEDLARTALAAGINTIIHTDIATDGMFTGPNLKAQKTLASIPDIQVIASGGVSGLEDIAQLRALASEQPNLTGVIVGKALYDGRLDLREAIENSSS